VRLRYSRKALQQLDDIFAFIEARDVAAARRVKSLIKRAIERLTQFPYSARAAEHPGVRVLVVRAYLVFYAVDETSQEIHVLRIRHGARDPSKHLE
jgi:toxin ParE1/3/4